MELKDVLLETADLFDGEDKEHIILTAMNGNIDKIKELIYEVDEKISGRSYELA